MRVYLALYVMVFALSALVAYVVLSYGYTSMHMVTVTTTSPHTVTASRTYVMPSTLHTQPTTTSLRIFEAPETCFVVRSVDAEISSTMKRTISETTMLLTLGNEEVNTSTGTESIIEARRRLSEKCVVSAYSASKGVVKLLNASIEFAEVSKNYSYVAIDLILSASMPSKVMVVSICVEPLPLPFGWNGSSWITEFDEKHCLLRLSALPSYSYRVEPQIVELEPEKASFLHIELLFHGPIYGKYILVVGLSTGDMLELKFASPDYKDPNIPPPREVVELAKVCGYSVGG